MIDDIFFEIFEVFWILLFFIASVSICMQFKMYAVHYVFCSKCMLFDIYAFGDVKLFNNFFTKLFFVCSMIADLFSAS